MKRLLFVFLFVLPRILYAQNCGVERQEVKTLADAQAKQALASPVKSMTVSELAAMPVQSKGVLMARNDSRFPEELQRIRVSALVLGFKHEADSDYHIVLADPTNPKITMIAEIPSAECVPPTYRNQFAILQARFATQFGKPTAKFKKLVKPILVDVEGILFRDFIHGQTGVAKSGTEIHPILDITKNSASHK